MQKASSRLKGYFRDYDQFHRTYGNKVSHVIGISLIAMTLLGLLDRVTLISGDGFPKITGAMVLWAVGNAFYLSLHVELGLTMALTTGLFYWAGIHLPLPALWSLFALGWVAQYVGHYVYEKKSPAFYRNLVHLMIGPIYIQNYLLKLVQW